MLIEPLQYLINLGKFTCFLANHIRCPLKELKAAKLFYLKAKVELTDKCYRENQKFVDELYNEFYDDPEVYGWEKSRSGINPDDEIRKLTIENLIKERKMILDREELERLEKEEIEPIEVRQQVVLAKIEQFARHNKLVKLIAA